MDYEDISKALNWNRIDELVRTVRLPEWEYETLSDMLDSALGKWGPVDSVGLDVQGVEQPFVTYVPEREDLALELFPGRSVEEREFEPLRERLVIGVVDLRGERHERAGFSGGHAGPEVVDWKTASDLSLEWERRLAASWQWKMYCRAFGAVMFRYRGIEKSPWKRSGGRGVHKTRELTLRWPCAGWSDDDVDQYLRQNVGMRDTLWRSPGPWPRRMPWACKAYGRPCTYKSLCDSGTAPRQTVTPAPFSYSGIERFSLCPERWRLEKLIEGDEDEGAFGKAFHVGMAEAYTQLRSVLSKG